MSGPKKSWIKKIWIIILVKNKFYDQKNFESKKILGAKKLSDQKNSGQRKVFGQIKMLGPKKF